MRWEEWAATDAAIRAEFGYAVADDLDAARLLRPFVPAGNRLDAIAGILQGCDAVVVGCGPSLDAADARRFDGPVVAADGAVSWLREHGLAPSVVVTDLDGDPRDLAWAAEQGAAMVVHAHGDNRAALPGLAPRLGHDIFGTHQGPPGPGLAPLANPGGFTDGDRAVVLCEHVGARSARLVGFDFDAPPSKYSHRWDPRTKPAKLAWAKRVVQQVEDRGLLGIRRKEPSHAA